MEKVDIQEHAKTIAQTLKERNKHAIQQIEHLIELTGIDFVQETLAETQAIEADSGMKTNDGKRRRTAGGVFFYLIKPKLSPEQRVIIFPPIDWKKRREKKKAKQVATTTIATELENIPLAKPEAPSSNAPLEDSDQLAKLEAAAQTLRGRLVEMEAKGQKGVKMTKNLLTNTEKQIEVLLKENTE